MLADAQEAIHNFQVASRNSTHITFSWGIVDGYYSEHYIDYFRIYYVATRYSSRISYIYYTDSNLIAIGSSFKYTTTVTSFSTYGQYVMWVRVYRSSLSPSYSDSNQVYVEVGK